MSYRKRQSLNVEDVHINVYDGQENVVIRVGEQIMDSRAAPDVLQGRELTVEEVIARADRDGVCYRMISPDGTVREWCAWGENPTITTRIRRARAVIGPKSHHDVERGAKYFTGGFRPSHR